MKPQNATPISIARSRQHDTAAPSTSVAQTRVLRIGVWISMIGLLALAFVLRVYGANFGLPNLYYWDEPTVVQRAIRFGSGDLNPHFFYYPALYMYVLFAVSGFYFVFGKLTGHFGGVQDFAAEFFIDPSGVYLWARVATALVGTLAVYMTYRVGRRYFGQLPGFLGALFLAVSVLHTGHSHIAITDVPQSFFIIAAYLPLFWIKDRAYWRDYLLAGLLIGLGMATKYLPILLVPSVLVAHYLSSTPGLSFTARWPRWLGCWFAPKLWVAGLATFIGFFAGAPFNVIELGAFIADYQQQSILSSGEGGMSFGYFLLTILPGSLGWPLYLVALAGCVFIAWRGGATGRLFLVFPIVYMIFVGRYALVFARYMIPVEPFLAIAAGVALAKAYAALRKQLSRPSWAPAAALGLVALLLCVTPVYWAMRWNLQMANEIDTRTQAVDWVEQNIPAGAVVSLQSLYGRTFYNAPLMTDVRLEMIDGYIPEGGSFDAVREDIFAELTDRPVYTELPFDYDFAALKAAGVRYILISDQNWLPIVDGSADPTSPEARFKADLDSQATLVQRFVPQVDLNRAMPGGGLDLLPQLPPEISIYEIH